MKLSVEPEIAFQNDKPTFLEFYASGAKFVKKWLKISPLKEEYEKEIHFVFLNVDNQKWNNYIRKFQVNGIPQINLFDRKGNLMSTFIGKQEELTIRDSLEKLKRELKSQEDLLKNEFSVIKENKNNKVITRSHG